MKPGVLFSAKWKIAAAVFFLTVGLSFLSCAPLFAQGTAGKILGTVTDQSGGAIAGATVIVTDVDRNAPRTLTTGQSGEYDAPNLLPGNYKVRAEAKGFKAFDRSGIFLEVGGEIRINLVMQPGEVSQTITVTEAAPMIETTNAELGGTLQAQVIADLPLNGRNFENLLQLRPGVSIYPGGSAWAQSANGLRPQDNVYLVNGIDATDPWMSQSVFNAVMAAGDAGTILPVDAIDEFKTEMNPRAEYGWRPGAIVNLGIKSGTNSIHGSAYAYGRDTVLDARNYFDPVISNGTPFPKSPVALEQFGGTFGGPIKKDKLFYFVNFEAQRYSIGNPALISTPMTVSQAAGTGNKCNILTTGDCQASLIDACNDVLAAKLPVAPLSLSLAGLTSTCAIDPSKTKTDPGGNKFQGLFPVDTTGTILSDLASTNSVNGGLAKINYHLSDKNSLEAMYFVSQGDALGDDGPGSEVSNAWVSAQHARSQAFSADWTWTPNSTLVNEVRVGYSHYYQTFYGADLSQSAGSDNFLGNVYEIPTGITNPLYGGTPGITIQGAGFASGFIGIGWPKIIGPDAVLQITDHISVLRGKHSFKFGGDILRNTSTEDETSNAKGPVRFNKGGGNTSLINYFEGNLSRANLFLGDPVRTLSNEGYALFFQDDWRIKPRLMLNLGLRYEINTVVKDKNNQLANFDPVQGLVQGTPYHTNFNNFGPRVGLAWDVRGNGKTVVRAGSGILYEQMGFDVLNGEGNLLGLRTIPTGLPLFNNGSTTSLPLNGNIQLQSLAFTGGASLAAISQAWQQFDPTKQVAGQTTLYSSVATPACGDGFTQPAGYLVAPGPCEIFGVDPNLRVPFVLNWNVDVQQAIGPNLSLDVGYVGNRGNRLLGRTDINQPPPGAGWTAAAQLACTQSAADATPYDTCAPDPLAEQAALPFTAPCAANIKLPNPATPPIPPLVPLGSNSSGGPFNPHNSCFSYLSYITIVNNAYHSNYNGLQVNLTGRNFHGFSFTAGYTFSYARGDASGQGTGGNFPSPLNSYGNVNQQLYSYTDFDLRHRFTLSMDYAIPGRKGFGQMLEGWAINSIVLLETGAPFGLGDQTTDFSGTNVGPSSAGTVGEQWNFYGNPSDFTPVHGWTDTNGGWNTGGHGGLPYFSGGGPTASPTTNATCNAKAAALGPLAVASLSDLGCYAVGNSVLIPPAYGSYGTTIPNMFRDKGFRNWDLSVTKTFIFKERFKAEVRVEGFNILNHPDFSNPSGGPGGAIGDPSGGPPFGFSGLTPDTYSSNPQLGSGGSRAIQLGLKLSF
jgi:Carboxypeptidase regulatory-like domain